MPSGYKIQQTATTTEGNGIGQNHFPEKPFLEPKDFMQIDPFLIGIFWFTEFKYAMF
jgi:hypothetical protein